MPARTDVALGVAPVFSLVVRDPEGPPSPSIIARGGSPEAISVRLLGVEVAAPRQVEDRNNKGRT